MNTSRFYTRLLSLQSMTLLSSGALPGFKPEYSAAGNAAATARLRQAAAMVCYVGGAELMVMESMVIGKVSAKEPV